MESMKSLLPLAPLALFLGACASTYGAGTTANIETVWVVEATGSG